MDYEQKYFDLLYKFKKLEIENNLLKDDINLWNCYHNYAAIAICYGKRLHSLNNILLNLEIWLVEEINKDYSEEYKDAIKKCLDKMKKIEKR